MNKKIREMVMEAILFIAIFILPAGIAGNIDTHYKMDGIISSVNDEEIYVVDSTGEEWAFKGNGFNVGDSVKITFFTAYTDSTRYDDEIDNVEKM